MKPQNVSPGHLDRDGELLDLVLLVHGLLVLDAKEEGLQDEGHNDRHHHHREQVEAHEVEPAPLARHHGKALHDNEPVVHHGQLEQCDPGHGQALKVVEIEVADAAAVVVVVVVGLHGGVLAAVLEAVVQPVEQLNADDAVEIVDEYEDNDGTVEAGQQDDKGAEDVAEAFLEAEETQEAERTQDDDVKGGNVQLSQYDATRTQK